MPKFTNISDGPRGIYLDDALVMVEAGETVEGAPVKGEEPNEEWFASPRSAAAKEAAAEKAEDKA
ncbi:MAG: hypothetical protein ABW128_15525 [Rhizorhabdus sp.]